MNTQTRRNVIKGVIGVGVIGGSGAAAIRTQTPRVTAQTDVQSKTITGESPDGSVDEIRVTAKGTVEWSNLPASTHAVVAVLSAREPGGEYTELTVDSVQRIEGEEEIREPLEFHFAPQPIIEQTEWTAEDFSARGDGETKTTEIDVRVSAMAIELDDKPGPRSTRIAEDRVDHTLTVEVTNTEESGGGSGNPNVSATVQFDGSVEMRNGTSKA